MCILEVENFLTVFGQAKHLNTNDKYNKQNRVRRFLEMERKIS